MAQAAAISAGSALVAHTVDVVHNGVKFSWPQWAVIFLLAGWWGLILHNALPAAMPGRGAVIAVVGGLGALPAFAAARAAVPDVLKALFERLKALILK